MNILEALANTEFGAQVTYKGEQYLVIKKYPDNLALAVHVGADFPAPVVLIQLEAENAR